jgi:hypothetical protein
MYFMTYISHDAWDMFASSLNRNIPNSIKSSAGGIVPTIKTLKKRLSTAGFWQTMGQVELLNVSNIVAENAQAVGAIFDVTEHDVDNDFVLDASAITNVDDLEAQEMTHVHWGAFAVSPKTIVEDQCLMLRDNLLPTWQHILESGTIVLILSLDWSGRIVVDGSNSKVEQGVARIFMLNVNDARESPYLALPLCLVDGDESYELIQAILDVIQAILDVLLPKLRTLQKEGIALTDGPVRGCPIGFCTRGQTAKG